MTYIELQHRVTVGRLTNPYTPTKVGISTEAISWYAFTAGRLTNQSPRYNRNRITRPKRSVKAWQNGHLITRRGCWRGADRLMGYEIIAATGDQLPSGTVG
jgi:hypothetical protein